MTIRGSSVTRRVLLTSKKMRLSAKRGRVMQGVRAAMITTKLQQAAKEFHNEFL